MSVESVIASFADSTARGQAEELLLLQRDLAVAVFAQHTMGGALRKLLEIVCRIPGVDCGGVYRVDGTTGRADLLAHHGLSEAFVAAVAHIAPDNYRARVLLDGRPSYLGGDALRIAEIDGVLAGERLRMLAVLPQHFEGRVVAALNLGSHVVEDFSPDTRAVMEAIAAFMSGMIFRLDAQMEVACAKEDWERTFDAVPDLIMLLDKDHRITRVNSALAKRLGCAPAQAVGRFCYEAVHGLSAPPDYCPHARMLVSGKTERAAVTKAYFGGFFDVTVVPLRDADGVLTGSVHVAHDISDHKRMAREILHISDWEKTRIGQDLHDTLGQQLAGVAFLSQALAHTWKNQPGTDTDKALTQLVREAGRAVDLVRQVAHGLTPVVPGPNGLSDALRSMVERAQQIYGVVCVLHIDDGLTVVDQQVAAHLFFIAQEAVTNAARHGRARHIAIQLAFQGTRLELTINDDGVGLPEQPSEDSGLGLRSMQYRADLLGGILVFERIESGGMRVVCRLM